jgi:phosphoserine aminotransferase
MSGNKRTINFGAGPAALPGEVLAEAAEAVRNYNNTGLSILEIHHRDKRFLDIMEESKALVKELCGLNDDFEVLWMQGGGRHQFTMVPMNFLAEDDTAGYTDSGYWAHDAMETAKYYGNVRVLATSEKDNYSHLPQWPEGFAEDLSYVHFTTNNTIYGTQWPAIPSSNVPLVADMSSDIFSRQVNYSNCAMFYAVAQKNIGPAGVTLVVINKQMLKQIKRILPPMLSYAEHVNRNSLLNTAPVFAIYTSLLTLRWTKKRGIADIENENEKKASMLYAEIERNSLFSSPVKTSDRSKMNVCFTATDKTIEAPFLQYCRERGLEGLEGHRYVGSFRASLYNAIPLSAVEALVSAMKEFETTYLKNKA